MLCGPSADYLALLRGEITSEEYVAKLKATVDARLAAERRTVNPRIRRFRGHKEVER